jgi:ribosomal protein S18 acetylase RimI-like enzyme
VESKNTVAIKIYYDIGFRVTRMYGDVYEMELDMENAAESLGV